MNPTSTRARWIRTCVDWRQAWRGGYPRWHVRATASVKVIFNMDALLLILILAVIGWALLLRRRLVFAEANCSVVVRAG